MQQEPSLETPNNELTKPALHEGQKLAGCYVLKSELPTQSGTVVWLAQDEVLGKDVTLHFIPPAILQDARAISELRQEVKRNRQLIHPNILRVYDFVEDGAHAAISMDRIEGESLAALLRQKGRFEPQEIQPWLIQLAETLNEAHRTQYVHRDLSPENFYVRPTAGLLITNLGIGRTVSDAMERAGIAKGEAAHLATMSPQQMDGERPAATDDVYGMGALAFELLTGHAPFVGADIVPQIRKSVPPTVSEARTQVGAAAVSPDWDALVASCLAKNLDQRPKSCAEVAGLIAQAKTGAQAAPTQPVAPSVPDAVPVWADVRTKAPEGSAPIISSDVKTEPAKSSMPPLPHGASASGKPGAKPSLSATFPDLERPKSKAPAVLVALAAVAIGAGLYMKKSDSEQSGGEENAADNKASGVTKEPSFIEKVNDKKAPAEDIAKTTAPKLPEVASVKPENVNPPQTEPKAPPVAVATPPTKPVQVAPSPLPVANTGGPAMKTTANLLPEPEEISKPAKATSPAIDILPAAPATLPKLALPPNATAAQLEQLLAERKAAAVRAQEVAKAADTTQSQSSQSRDKHAAELEQMKKGVEDKRKAQASIIQQASAIEAQRKKLEDEKNRAKAAAMEALKASENAEKAFVEAMEQGADKITARQKADAEMAALTKEIADRTKALDETGGQSTKADSLRQQMQLALRQLDLDQVAIKAALGKVKSVEDEARRKANHDKIVALESQAKPIEAKAAQFKEMLAKLKELGDAGIEASKPLQQKLDALNADAAAIRSAIKDLGNSSVAPAVALPPAAQINTPPPAVVEVVPPQPAPTEAGPSTNSLGMKFLPVGNIAFAIYPTTRQQFEAFAKAVNLRSTAWQNPGFKQENDHPVVNITWREAEAFCKWLTVKERKANQIKPNELYRLPSDMEWSKAVGLTTETGVVPEDRDMEVQGVYPWGTVWPPPAGAGNYAGEETEADTVITGYNDGYKNTSPVGKFQPNSLGLYDMGGNVWQWVQDDWNANKREKTLRGASWYNGAIQLTILSSGRIPSSPDNPNDTYGFRVVKAAEASKTAQH